MLLGGHTVDDDELKYGLSVTGTVHPQKILTNKGSRPGDVLILTKKHRHRESSPRRPRRKWPTRSAAKSGGFHDPAQRPGGAGHGRSDRPCLHGHHGLWPHRPRRRNGQGAGLSFRLLLSKIPVSWGTRDYAGHGLVPGGRLLQPGPFRQSDLLRSQVPETERILLFDPQTSGGLLIALPAAEGERLLRRSQGSGNSRGGHHRRGGAKGRKANYRGIIKQDQVQTRGFKRTDEFERKGKLESFQALANCDLRLMTIYAMLYAELGLANF